MCQLLCAISSAISPVLHCKKKVCGFPSPAGMPLTRKSLVSGIPAGDGKIDNFFYSDVPGPHSSLLFVSLDQWYCLYCATCSAVSCVTCFIPTQLSPMLLCPFSAVSTDLSTSSTSLLSPLLCSLAAVSHVLYPFSAASPDLYHLFFISCSVTTISYLACSVPLLAVSYLLYVSIS
jgi:hypothetical protein